MNEDDKYRELGLEEKREEALHKSKSTRLVLRRWRRRKASRPSELELRGRIYKDKKPPISLCEIQ